MLQIAKKGFTLIELLVVITIIGILATGAVTVYTAQIQKARDTTRINDIKALESWIQQFYQDKAVYPIGGADWLWTGTSVTDYVPTLAQDPKHDQTCNGSRCGYVYTVWPDGNDITQGSFEISTAFENQGNVDNKAIRASDNGEDDNRFEVGLLKTGTTGADLVTLHAQGTAFSTTAIDASNTATATLVIKKSALTAK